ncbi:MAG: sugar phosphate isomerase/epimerase [Saprospiraceae bacterium]|nr:sugar phosphate isomerase/epimerase [Saprospiraceae bacterium]
MQRREILKALLTSSAVTGFGFSSIISKGAHSLPAGSECSKVRISLNAYSFNELLRNGEMDLTALFQYCKQVGFDGVDITAYYVPGYPEVPADEVLYDIKRMAFKSGLEISGTGVRNDFTDPDPEKRKADIQLVKNWIRAAAKLGAPVVRIFAGHQEPEGYTWNQMASWMVEDIRSCVSYGKQHGVITAIQNHNGFLKTADQVKQIFDMVDSPWFGVILDTGSFRTGDPYAEIQKTIPLAVSWQVKEKIWNHGKEEDIDLDRLVSIIHASCYRGYLPIETLGAGDPREKVAAMYGRLQAALQK